MTAALRHRLILASGSPRRRELLAAAGYTFEVVTPSEAAECGVCNGAGEVQHLGAGLGVVGDAEEGHAASVPVVDRPWVHVHLPFRYRAFRNSE